MIIDPNRIDVRMAKPSLKVGNVRLILQAFVTAVVSSPCTPKPAT